MKLYKWLITLSLATALIAPTVWSQGANNAVVQQQSPLLDRLKNVGTDAGYVDNGESGMLLIVGYVINGLLGLLGAIFIILILLAGYNWMTANGDEAKIDKAKDTIRASIIGLIIIVGAFAIWKFVAGYLITGGGSAPSGPNSPPG